MMQWLAIVLLSVLTCVTYGIVHDQITARICVEYFTIGHSPGFDTDDPTLLGHWSGRLPNVCRPKNTFLFWSIFEPTTQVISPDSSAAW